MPKTSTHVVLTSRKHTTGFFVKRFGDCCGNTVWRAACYWLSIHCIPAQKFVFVSVELNHIHSPLVLYFDTTRMCCHRFSSYSIIQGPQNLFMSEGYKCCCTTVRGPDILRSVIALRYVTFYQINNFS